MWFLFDVTAGVCGFPGKSKTGQLSVVPKSVKVLASCLEPIPGLHYGIKNPVRELQHCCCLCASPVKCGLIVVVVRVCACVRVRVQDVRHRQRYLDIMINDESRKVFMARSKARAATCLLTHCCLLCVQPVSVPVDACVCVSVCALPGDLHSTQTLGIAGLHGS